MTPAALLPLGAAAVAFATGVLVLRPGRRTPFSRPLAGVMFCATWWGVMGSAATVVADRPAAAVGFLAALVPSAAAVVAFGAWHTMGFSGRTDLWTRRTTLLLAVQPVLVLAVAVTNPWTGWVVRVAPANPSGLGFGPGFWVHTAYCYALTGSMGAMLLTARRRAVRGQRRHLDVALGVIVVPFVANVACLAMLPQRWLDTTSAAFVVTALVWLGAERWASAMRQGPVSTAEVIHAIGDGVVVLDVNRRVVEVNPAAEQLLVEALHQAPPYTGRRLAELVPADLAEAGAAGRPATIGTRTFDVRVTPVLRGDRAAATVVVVRDITEIAELHARLEDRARTDALTGLANRYDLDALLDDAAREVRRTGRPTVLAMVDIDRFKRVNDQHGHAAGDRVLQAVAGVLRDVPEASEVFRLGGEEFLVLLPDVGADEAGAVLEGVRERCAALRVAGRGHELRVTVSIGAAVLGSAPGAVAPTLAAADAALYAAKAAGRDRVVLGPQAPAAPSPRGASQPR